MEEESTKSKIELPEDQGLKIGYRVWKLDFDSKGIPSLRSPSYTHFVWKEGENKSDLDHSGTVEDIMASGKGFYSLKSPEGIVKAGYYPETGKVLGSILNYGHVVEAPKGYRSQYATINSLWVGGEKCDLCGKTTNAPATHYISSGERGEDWCACSDCLKLIKKVVPKFETGYPSTGIPLEELRFRLGSKYNTYTSEIPQPIINLGRKY